MPRTLKEMIAEMPEERQDAVARRAQELTRQISLRELRKTLGISQKQLAEALKVSQTTVSKQERRKEIQVGTLCGVIEAMGGSVEITAHFPGDKVVRLTPSLI